MARLRLLAALAAAGSPWAGPLPWASGEPRRTGCGGHRFSRLPLGMPGEVGATEMNVETERRRVATLAVKSALRRSFFGL